MSKVKIKQSKQAVYKITNEVNGKVYVGSTTHYGLRWAKHRWELKNGRHGNSKMNADGIAGHTFQYEILEFIDEQYLERVELAWMKFLKPQYNKKTINPK